MVEITGPAPTGKEDQSKSDKNNKSTKMKSSTTKNDVIDKGKTIIGSKPDTININPVTEKAIADIEKIYDSVMEDAINSSGGGAVRGLGYVTGDPMGNDNAENNYVNANIANADTQDNILKGVRNAMHDALHARFAAAISTVKEGIDRSNTFLRDRGTTSLTNIYKHDTPGQVVNDKFRLQFKDEKKDKEAVSRSGNPDRKEIDLVPREDPERDRKKDSSFFRQQSIVKRRKDVDEAFTEAYAKGYKSPWDKIEKAKPGIGKRIDAAVAGLKQNADDLQAIKDRESKEKKVSEESEVNEISKKLTHSFITKMLVAHPDTISMSRAKGKDIRRKKALDLALDKEDPKSAIHKPHVLATEDTTTEKDPIKHLEDRLNTATDKSHNGIDKIMRQVANDYNMDVHDLHDKWVKKAGCTPDEYVNEQRIRLSNPNWRARYAGQKKPLSPEAEKILKDVETGNLTPSTKDQDQSKKKMNEDLRDWFKDKWVRMDTKGNIKGDCAREPGEGKPKCLPQAKAQAMDKDDRAAAARRKRREDPVADRPGKGSAPINVRTEETEYKPEEQITFGNYTTHNFDMCPTAVKLYTGIENKTVMVHLAVENLMLQDALFRLERQLIGIGFADKDDIEKAEDIADLIMHNARQMKLEKEHSYIFDTHIKRIRDLHKVQKEAANPAQQAAIAIALIKAGKKKGKDPGPQKEEVEYIEEKNKPTNPALWSRAKSLARSKFDVYPSAYANGWAAKWYKSKGGGWKSVSEESVNELSNELIGKVNKTRTLYGPQSKTQTASKTLDKAVEKVRAKTEVGKFKEELNVDEALTPLQIAASKKQKKKFTQTTSKHSNLTMPTHKVTVIASQGDEPHEKIKDLIQAKDKHKAIFAAQIKYHKKGYNVHKVRYYGIHDEEE